MYQHKTGYAPGEQFATHARRRYRLLPSKFPNSTGPPPDPALWIIHYTQSDPHERVPSNVIPIDLRIQHTMNTRAYLHSQGQIVQKDFMLHDRANWPQISFPKGPPRGPPMYGANVPQARIPQAMAYPTQHATAGPPPKRVRTATNTNQAAAGNAVAVLDIDDEEDTSRGDLFDHTTPREISVSRYKQNHEWMEEILSSPYSINQIIPADLGLGVRGELASLTAGIFDAPFDPEKDIAKHTYVGRLDPEKADEFRKRAHDRIAQTNREIEKMKAKHARRLAKFQKGSLITISEEQLRTAVDDPTDTGPEYWRLEGRIDDEDNEDGKAVSRVLPKVDDIVAQVEASVGRHAAAVKELIRIQDGGYEEALAIPSPPPAPAEPTPQITPPGSHNGSTHSGVLVGDADLDMSNSAAGMLDQYHTGLSSNATPGSNFPTPQPHLQQSSVGTPNLNIPSPQPAALPNTQQPSETDVNMADGPSNEQSSSNDQPGGDWVVVPPGGVSPTTAQAQPPTVSADQTQSHPPHTASAPISTASPFPLTGGTSAVNTPGLPDFHTSPNDFADLGDLDTAGDALASYEGLGEGEMGDLGDLGEMGMDMGGDMDDSAFGDAFHGVEQHHHEEEGMGDGL
jgi:hypothetical protein